MSVSLDIVRTKPQPDQRETSEEADSTPDRKALDVSDIDPDRVEAYARATAAEGHPELYFERKGGRTYLVSR